METRLWRIIERLRGGIDVRDYKHLILPLVFLRSADIDFSKRLLEISKMKHFSGELLPEFFVENGGVYLPDDARWEYLVSCAKEKTSNLSARVDRAFRVISETNPSLDGLFSDGLYVRKISSEKLAEIILEINKIERLNLSEVYEDLIRRFSAKETRGRRNNEYFTSPEVMGMILAEMFEEFEFSAEDFSGKIFDPCVGMGGMVLPILKRAKEAEVFGQEINPTTYKLSKMNFVVNGVKSELRLSDAFLDDVFPNLEADLVLCNPPFNQKTKEFKNANFAWISRCLSKLSSSGIAAIILPGTAMVDANFAMERKELVSSGALRAILNLPRGLFYRADISVSVWFFKKGEATDFVRFVDGRGSERRVKDVLREEIFSSENVSLAPSDYIETEVSLRPEKIDFSDEISKKIAEKEMEIRKLRGMLDFSIDWSEISGVPLSEIIEEVDSEAEILPGEFAVNLLHVGRDEKLPVVLNSSDESMAVSKSYFKFRIRKKWSSKLPAEYLLMLLSRPEIAEELAFLSDKSAWGEVSKEDFLKIKF